MRPTRIIIHHSTNNNGETFTWSEMKNFHTSYVYKNEIVERSKAIELMGKGERVRRPWKNIGYHFGIGMIDGHHEILMGRFPYEKGAHAGQYNNDGSIGIVFIGNHNIESIATEEWDLAIKLVKYLRSRYKIAIDKVYRHSDFNSDKSCPGKLFNLDDFKKCIYL